MGSGGSLCALLQALPALFELIAIDENVVGLFGATSGIEVDVVKPTAANTAIVTNDNVFAGSAMNGLETLCQTHIQKQIGRRELFIAACLQ